MILDLMGFFSLTKLKKGGNMNMKDQARLKMHQRMEAYLLKHPGITGSLPNFATLFALFRQGIAAVLELMKEQEGSSKSSLLSKAEARASLEALAFDVSGKLVAYATNKPKRELLSKINFTKTELETCTDYVLVSHAKILCETVTLNLADLEVYRIKQADVDAMLQLGALLLQEEPLPEVEVKDQVEITKALEARLRENQEVLKQIDAEMLIVRCSEVVFYREYWLLRKIIYSWQRKLAVKGRVIHKGTREGLKGVTIIFEAADEETAAALKAYTGGNAPRKTARMGGFTKKSFIEGAFKVTASKVGFITQRVTVYIRNGETTRILFEMQAV